jgi:hypothetical protein
MAHIKKTGYTGTVVCGIEYADKERCCVLYILRFNRRFITLYINFCMELGKEGYIK